MMIDRIGAMNPVFQVKTNAYNRTNRFVSSDTISVSSEAIKRNELDRMERLVKTVPEVRADLVAEMKAQIKDPAFFIEEALSVTVDKLMEAFGII